MSFIRVEKVEDVEEVDKVKAQNFAPLKIGSKIFI